MRRNRHVGAVTALGVLALALCASCGLVAGIGEYCVEGKDPGCGTGGNAGTGGGGGATTSEGGGTTTTSTGGGGAGGGPECTPPATQDCYTGSPGTQDVGLCKGGTQSCTEEGTWGPCEGEQLPVPEDCAAPADEDCNFGTGCSETVWGKVFGDGSVQWVRDVAFDAAGNLYAVGRFSGTLDFNGGQLIAANNDVFVVKLGPAGNHIWSRRYGDSEEQSADGVTVDSDGNVIVVGYFEGVMQVGNTMLTTNGGKDAFVLKLSPEGEKIWAKGFGDEGVSQSAQDVATDAEGNIILAGTSNGEMNFDGKKIGVLGDIDGFVAKLSPSGNAIWAFGIGGDNSQYCTNLAVDSVGNVSVTGQFFGSITFSPGNTVTATGPDIYVARLDSAGGFLWAKKIDTLNSALPFGLVADSAGDIIVSFETNSTTDAGGGTITPSTYDAVLVKYSSGGVFQWQKQIGGTGEEYAPELAVDSNKRPVVAFHTDGPLTIDGVDLPSGGGHDIVVAALEPSGALRWAKRYGLISDQTSPVVTVGPKGQIGLGCLASGNIDFGLGSLPTMGSDVALAVIGPN